MKRDTGEYAILIWICYLLRKKLRKFLEVWGHHIVCAWVNIVKIFQETNSFQLIFHPIKFFATLSAFFPCPAFIDVTKKYILNTFLNVVIYRHLSQ